MKIIILFLSSLLIMFLLAFNSDIFLKNEIDDKSLSFFISNANANTEAGGFLGEEQITTTECKYNLTTTVTVIDPNTGSSVTTTETVEYTGVLQNCIDGFGLCSKDCVGKT